MSDLAWNEPVSPTSHDCNKIIYLLETNIFHPSHRASMKKLTTLRVFNPLVAVKRGIRATRRYVKCAAITPLA